MIDASYINAFIQAIENVFNTMLQTDVTVRKPVLKSDEEPRYDVSSIIGLSGDIVGSIVLSFPVDVASTIAFRFTGMELAPESEDFADALGELVNMISGNAKASFTGKNANISCPTVVIGKDHRVFRQSDMPAIELPCDCNAGEFILEVAMKDYTEASGQQANAAQAQA